MKRSNYLQVFIVICGLSLLAGGCLFKSSPVQARNFILTPLQAPASGQATPSPAIEVEFVKMPSYLLRDSMVVRKGAGEFEVLENAVWAERLDEGFRRVLEDNLTSLVASEQAHLSATGRTNEATVRVSVNVQEFDVDTLGRGTLLASWRITQADAAKPVKTGEVHLTRNGSPPRGNPQAVATTLSDLIAEFSRQLAAVPRDTAEPKS